MLRVGLALAAAILLPFGCSQDKGTGPDGVNHPPVIESIRDTTAVVGDTLEIAVSAFDQDGDELHFNLVYKCTWLEIVQDRCAIAGIHTAGPVFWLWPRSFDVPARHFTIIALDGRGGRDTTAFFVVVSAR